MAHFKVEPTGCGERNGLVQVRFNCFFDESDPEYPIHYVTVPVFPKEGYPGAVDEIFGHPVDEVDYRDWVSSLPTVSRENPFCCHFRRFEADVTDEEIVAAGKEILAMSYKNFKDGDLGKNTNKAVQYTTSIVKIQASISRVSAIKTTDYAAVESAVEKKEP